MRGLQQCRARPPIGTKTVSLRSIATTPQLGKKSDQLPPRPTLPDHELDHTFLKGSGPGGQKINKTNSAVQMTHLPTGIVVKSQATRSKSQNFTIARRILAEKIELLQKGPESRAAKKEERVRKKKASASKKSKRKYRKLAEEKESAKDDEGEGDEDIRDIPEEVGSDMNIGAKP